MTLGLRRISRQIACFAEIGDVLCEEVIEHRANRRYHASFEISFRYKNYGYNNYRFSDHGHGHGHGHGNNNFKNYSGSLYRRSIGGHVAMAVTAAMGTNQSA